MDFIAYIYIYILIYNCQLQMGKHLVAVVHLATVLALGCTE
jgi:hypothetical protein